MTALDLFLTSPWPYLATAALAALTGWYVWTRPRRPGSRYFGWLTVLWLVWSLAAALQVVVRDYPLLLGLFVLMSSITMLESVLHLMIGLEYTGNEKWLARRSLNLLFLPAVLVALMYILWPGWLGTAEIHAGVQVIQVNASLKWIFAPYPLLVSLLTLGVLLNCLLRAPAFRVPLLLLSLGRIFPMVGYLAVEPRNIPVPPVQATVLFTGITILLYLVALYSFRVLQVIPVARDAVIAHIPYALIVLDAENCLVDFNDAARSLPGMPARLSLHQPAGQMLAGWWERLAPLIGAEPVSQDVPVSTSSGGQIFHATSLPLIQASGRRIGQSFLIEDVTQARQAQQQQEQAQRALAMLGERERLARELHDSLGQVFAFINTQGQTVQRLLDRGDLANAETFLGRLVEVAREADIDIRESILGLRVILNEQGLFPALEQYLCRYEKNYAIHTELEQPETLAAGLLEPLVEVQLLRILQEALTNIRKHTRATCVKIAYSRQDSLLRVTIQDNGQGFDPSTLGELASEHVGLRVMRERAEEVGGRLRVESAPGEGTRVVVELPVRIVNSEQELRRPHESSAG